MAATDLKVVKTHHSRSACKCKKGNKSERLDLTAGPGQAPVPVFDRGTSLTKQTPLSLGPYCRPVARVQRGSYGGGHFFHAKYCVRSAYTCSVDLGNLTRSYTRFTWTFLIRGPRTRVLTLCNRMIECCLYQLGCWGWDRPLRSGDVFHLPDKEQWLERQPEAGSSWPSWPGSHSAAHLAGAAGRYHLEHKKSVDIWALRAHTEARL